MNKLLTLLLLLLTSIVVNAQRGDTVYQQLVSNSSSLLATKTVNNIGQSQHKAMVQLINAPAHICAAQNVDVEFIASYDNTTYFSIGTALTTIVPDNAGLLIGIFEANGAYPYIKVLPALFDTTNCRISINYTGVLFANPADVAVISEYQARNLQAIPFSVASGGGNNTVITNPYTSKFLVVYGIVLVSSVNAVVTINDNSGGGIGMGPITMLSGVPLVVPSGGTPQFTLNRGKNLIFNTVAAAQLSGWIVIRYEDNP